MEHPCRPESEWNLTPGSPAKLTKYEPMRDLPIKHCEHCGKELSPAKLSAATYKRRRYCNQVCRAAGQKAENEWHRATDTKTCQRCGKTFARPATMGAKNWKYLKYCGSECRYSAQNDRQTRDGTPFDRDTHCYCGHPATERVYFLQATALGFASDAYLDVCADCRDLFLESDPGASLAPRHSPRGARLWRNNEDTPLPYSPPHGGLAYRRTYHA